jgi:hypothetical protein
MTTPTTTRPWHPTTDWNRAFHLSGVELDACWELLDLADTPVVLQVPSPGRTSIERQHILRATLTGLARRGLTDRHRPTPALASALRLMAHSDYELDIRLAGGPPHPTVGLGAIAGDDGVLVVQRGDRLMVLPTDRVRVLPGLIELAGPMTPGIGRPVTLAADVFDHAITAATDNPATFADELHARGLTRTDANATAHIYRNVHTIGQLGATTYTGGVPRRGPWVIGFHHTHSGTFGQLRKPDPTGTTSITLAPLDARRLTAHATELINHTTSRTTTRPR